MSIEGKQCPVCKEAKQRSEYHNDRNRKDGMFYCCKSCVAKRGAEWRKRNPERSKNACLRWARKNQDRIRELRKERWRNPQEVDKKNAYLRRYRRNNPKKIAAHKAVERALLSGEMVRKPCEICGTMERVHAHHEDYDRPLDVQWLCVVHHGEAHRKPVGV